MERDLTPRELEAYGAITHYHETLGRPVPAAHVAESMAVSHERARQYFKALSELGWLRGAGSPAIPTRPLPRHPVTLDTIQVDTSAREGHGGGVKNDEPHARVVDMPPLSVRADLVVKSMNDEARTVELVFSTGAGVERMDYFTGKRYLETLSLDPAHVRLERPNSGGPLLDSHSAWSVADQLGAVVPGSVTLAKKEARATVKFSRRESVEPVWQDIADGIVRAVSVGYRVHKFEETASSKSNALPIRRATDWEPFEVSIVPIPADAGAKVRNLEDVNPCEIVEQRQAEENPMRENESEFVVEPQLGTPKPATPPAPPAEPNDHDVGVRLERARCQGILAACSAARLPRSYADNLIAEEDKDGRALTLVEAQSRVFVEMAKRRDPYPNVPNPGGDRPQVEVGDDPLVHERAGIVEALLHRIRPKPTPKSPVGFDLTERGRTYRGLSLLDIAKILLNSRGVRTSGLSRMEIAGSAFGLGSRGAMHTTSDFASLLEDVANKTLRQAYDEAPQTFAPFSARVTLPDFKASKRLQLGEAPQLLEVAEHGEFTRGTMGESKEEFALASYGRIFAITRRALVNDDTSAFARIPMFFGRMARQKESDLVWAQITANANMGDGVALFHATHGNLAGSGAVISIDTIGAGRSAMRQQTGVDGATLLNIAPAYLVVPSALETVADQFVSVNLAPDAAGNVNPFAGRLQVIAEPRLDADSAIKWYLVTTPSQIDTMEYAYLEGEEGPQVESRIGFEVDGLEIKARHDFAAKVIDHRGFYQNPGA